VTIFTRFLFQAQKSAFEFVLLDAKALYRAKPNRNSFSEHFKADCEVVAFKNLGGDAALVVPCPRAGDPTPYTHLAAFVGLGPKKQAS